MSTTDYVISDGICIVCSRVSDMATPKVTSFRQRCALCYNDLGSEKVACYLAQSLSSACETRWSAYDEAAQA
jgi:hypothetical protein